jgi:hypothetical protein
MGSTSEQDYQDILRESVGAWFRLDEDDEDEKSGFICKECIGDNYRQYDPADMLTEKKLNTFLKHGDINCDKCGKGGASLRL